MEAKNKKLCWKELQVGVGRSQEKSGDLNNKMISAAESGDNEGVIRLLKEGAEVTSMNRKGNTGLHLSARCGYDNVLRTILAHGIDVNLRGYRQRTALMWAAVRGHLTSLQILLDNGADLHIKNKGWTSLMYAAENNHPEIVAELLARGADEKAVNIDGESAMHLAEECNNHDVVRMLKASGNEEILNQEMVTAAKEGKEKLVTGIIRAGADLETKDKHNDTGLHLSALNGHESVVRVILQNGIGVNIRGYDDWTPLHSAAQSGHFRIAKLLMDHKADLNLQSSTGWTALMLAANNGHANIVMELLERGADRDIENRNKKTALHYAQKGIKPDIGIAVILDRGKILTDDQNGAKAVLAATEAGCPNVVSDLLERGANMDTRNDMGETLFQIAARLPKTRKDEYEEYLKEVKRKKKMKPRETQENVLKEAEAKSRELAKVFLSQSLNDHDPVTISNYLIDIVNFVNKGHCDFNIFDNEQKFFTKYDKKDEKQTLLQSVLNKGLVKEREEVLYVLKKVDQNIHPTEQEDADYRMKEQVKKACSSSVGLRDCLESIDEKYPWSNLKHNFMIFLSFVIFLMGTTFYVLDIYTDIKFSLEMFNYSTRNFTQELSL